jgi:hypothetical protein
MTRTQSSDSDRLDLLAEDIITVADIDSPWWHSTRRIFHAGIRIVDLSAYDLDLLLSLLELRQSMAGASTDAKYGGSDRELLRRLPAFRRRAKRLLELSSTA